MKKRAMRILALTVCAMMPLAAYPGASRICSIFVESYSSLQQQLFQGAEIFEAPQLGALPMMLTMTLPGAAQINPQNPIALHLFDTGGGKVAFVLETTPVGTPEAYLQAVQGHTAQPPDPITGIYTFDGGVARIAGDRVLLSPLASDLEACTSKDADAFAPLPDIPGTVRILLSPGALKHLFEHSNGPAALLSQLDTPNAAQAQRSLDAVVDFYQEILGQMAWLQIGIAIQKDGLVIDMRVAPTAGSDLAALLASIKPVTAKHRAFLAKDSLFGLALGGYILPQHLRDQMLRFYAQMLPQATAKDEKLIDVAALMGTSLRALGAPLATTATLTTNTVLTQGVFDIADAAGYLNEQMAMMKTPEFQTLMTHSGMTLTGSPTRVYKGITIHPFTPRFDEESFKQNLRNQHATGTTAATVDLDMEKTVETMQTMSGLFGTGYEYAAVGPSLVFGMGMPTMIEQAIDRVNTPVQTAGEADRIQALLQPPVVPYAIGRFSLSALSRMALTLANVLPPEAAAALPAGDGILFTKWSSNGEANTRILLPSSEIKAIKAAAQAAIRAQNNFMPTDEEPPAHAPNVAVPPALE